MDVPVEALEAATRAYARIDGFGPECSDVTEWELGAGLILAAVLPILEAAIRQHIANEIETEVRQRIYLNVVNCVDPAYDGPTAKQQCLDVIRSGTAASLVRGLSQETPEENNG